MRVTVERLRAWIMVLAGVLIATILLFFGYARWQIRHLGRDLPGRLGFRIQQSTDGFTLSRSEGGHTVFTLHASKAIQFKGAGNSELHDVSIMLYGADGTPAARIYGSDFNYDSVHEIARANGAVQIDLQGIAGSGDRHAGAADDDADNKNTVHIKTSDLVINQGTGAASTDKAIEFRLAEAAGSGSGASFDSQKGLLILNSDVVFNSSLGGNPLAVRAHHAQFDRASRELYLLQDSADYQDSHSSSDQATVYFRADGSAYRVTAQGHVALTGNDGQRITSQNGDITLNQKSQPEEATLDGGILYVAKTAARQMHVVAYAGTLLFGPQSTVRHAQLRNAVSIVDEEQPPPPSGGKRSGSSYQSTTRQAQASRIDIDFAQGPDDRPMAQHILGVGGARIDIHDLYEKTPPQETSVEGDQLFATLTDGVVLSSLRGTGHTKLTLLRPDGEKQTSTGDNLLMTFLGRTATPATEKLPASAAQPAAQLQSAVQEGNVTLLRETPDGPGESGSRVQSSGKGPAESTATAQRVNYDARTQLIELSGEPRIRDASGELAAASIELDRTTGNATAVGNVKATYRQSPGLSPGPSSGQPPPAVGGSEPVHIVADRAHLDRGSDLTIFYSGSAGDARLWQGGNSIAAPVIELARSQQSLRAHGSAGSDSGAVKSIFVSAGNPSTRPAAAPGARQAQNSVMRLESRSLVYAETEHKAVFAGGVVARTPSGILQSRFMDVYFSGAGERTRVTITPQGAAAGQASQIERIVAHGDVQLEQPGRKGVGESLVYTAQDGKFVLTGTGKTPPYLVDQQRGTVTGASLIFNDRDDSVMVSGGPSNAVTETRVKK